MSEKNINEEKGIGETEVKGENFADIDEKNKETNAGIEKENIGYGEENSDNREDCSFDEDGRAAAPAADAAGGAASGETTDINTVESIKDGIYEEHTAGSPEAVGAATESPCGGALPEISNSDMRRIMADPMFICFAKGKNSDIETLCRDFCQMIACGESARQKSNLDSSVLMRVTPYAEGMIRSEVILTERQRTLAREAGMTYREYYDLINDIPERTTK